MKILSRAFIATLICISYGATAQNTTGICDLFEDGPNDNWPRVLTATTPADPTSSSVQTMQINILSMPDSASYRVAKTVANGNWYFSPPQLLELGSNTVTVDAPNPPFDRSVKFQFSSGDIEFDALSINGGTLTCASDLDGVAMENCDEVDDGPNATWPHVVTATTPDDPNSASAQTMSILVTALPDAGAFFRVVKTVANGNWNNGAPMDLEVGNNEFTVSEVTFSRSVKFQFSSGEIEFAELVINGAGICGPIPCEDANNNDICDADEDTIDPASYCGSGTTWDEALNKCVGAENCMGDFDGDGVIATSDLLGFLAIFGTACL